MAKMGIGISFIFVLFLVAVTVPNFFGSGPISFNVHKVRLT